MPVLRCHAARFSTEIAAAITNQWVDLRSEHTVWMRIEEHGICLITGCRSMLQIAYVLRCVKISVPGRAEDWLTMRANMGAFEHELERLNHYCEEEPWALAS
jgi:hypothetical protein